MVRHTNTICLSNCTSIQNAPFSHSVWFVKTECERSTSEDKKDTAHQHPTVDVHVSLIIHQLKHCYTEAKTRHGSKQQKKVQ